MTLGCTPDVPHPGESCVDVDVTICEPGTHVAFVSSTDEHTRLRGGDTGIVLGVDDMNTTHISWDPDGHVLGLIPGVDVWRPLHPRWDGEHAPMSGDAE
ncbi:hypothetical protein SAMN04489809_1205 [Microbacterium paraoxydans]|uniref:DUF4314 domain-containing protein n=2 Tax=Microbacterium paraoxydans TaxID=199592 RepID=A0A1H1PVN8_9MICO|nr:DUF4314 domain-containing protein [Microbacterium paraoxydans]SDS15245.1 hypothetical protein SAMN04489809_1205 [Microbacterium paraoxydans]